MYQVSGHRNSFFKFHGVHSFSCEIMNEGFSLIQPFKVSSERPKELLNIVTQINTLGPPCRCYFLSTGQKFVCPNLQIINLSKLIHVREVLHIDSAIGSDMINGNSIVT